ncbi:MAG TPA: phosphate ABC transporter substrate-binding protein [Devosiaceae bacterium]|jgi:4,5-dihydroxyphthalate decarboxylase
MVTLHTNLGDHAAFMPIKTGALSAAGLTLDFCGPRVPHTGFKDMVRRGAYDFGEFALGTFLQAVIYDKPLMLLPVTIVARFPHPMIECRSAGRTAPSAMAGRRIGVRTYSQTTAIWVRGILDESYGVDPADVTWVCTDDAHLAEYVDPPNVERSTAASEHLPAMLVSGEIDALIVGGDMAKKRDGIEPLIPEPNAAARAWYGRHGYVPINHMLAIGRDVAERHPEAVRDVYRLFAEAKASAPIGPDGIDFLPVGFEAVRAPVEAMIDHAFRQRVIPRRLSFDEVFGDAARLLGA